jgi:hypothetical protein
MFLTIIHVCPKQFEHASVICHFGSFLGLDAPTFFSALAIMFSNLAQLLDDHLTEVQASDQSQRPQHWY